MLADGRWTTDDGRRAAGRGRRCGAPWRCARAWAFDRHRLFLMLPDGSDQVVDLSSRACQDALRQRCYNLQPELVVVDSLAAATSRGETSLEGARTVLSLLSALADQFQMALLVIHHLRRRTGSGQA